MANKLISIAPLENINQAIRIQEWLDSAGIESYILDHGINLEAVMQLEGEVELQVNDTDALKALEIIGNMADNPLVDQLNEDVQIIQKILIPVDFSDISFNAACYAAHVAKQKGAALTLIHVYFNPVTDPIAGDHFYSFPTSFAETVNEIIDNARILMNEFSKKLNFYLNEHNISDLPLNIEIIGGTAEDCVLDFANTGKFDMLIIGIKGRGGEVEWLGSFAFEIINKSLIPVLAIPEKAIYKESMFKRLMYATNFDKSDGKAIRKLVKIAKPLETHISVVHVDDTDDNPFINYDLAHFKEKYIGNLPKVTMDFDLIVNKNQAKGIKNYILDHEIDIISITSHKRNLLTSIFRPSLTKELLFQLEIPMLIFHA